MNIIDALKKKVGYQVVDEEALYKQRKQLNVEVNAFLKLKLIRLAAQYAVPLYAIMEHLSQVGLFYLDKAQENPRIKDIVRSHVIDQHLISSTDTDSEEILRLGEGRYASELIPMSRKLVKLNHDLQKAFYHAKQTGETEPFEQIKKQLLESAFTLANWLSSHPFDEMDEDGEMSE